MKLTNNEQVMDQFKIFLPRLRKIMHNHALYGVALKRDKLYQNLKRDAARWSKRSFPRDEATATAWKLRKITIKKMVKQVITAAAEEEERTRNIAITNDPE